MKYSKIQVLSYCICSYFLITACHSIYLGYTTFLARGIYLAVNAL